MKRFHSSASRVLGLSRQKQRLCELLVARARAEKTIADQRERDALRELGSTDRALLGVLAHAAEISVIQSTQLARERAMSVVEQRQEECRDAAAQLAEVIRELRTQQQRTRSLEHLESRHFQAWQHDMAAEQSHRTDELAASRRCRNQLTGGETWSGPLS